MNNPVVQVIPDDPELHRDPSRIRIWIVNYRFKTELYGWATGPSFVLPCAADQKPERKAVLLAAGDHPDCIGIELTSCRLHSPLTAEPS